MVGSLRYLNKFFYTYRKRFLLGFVFVVISNIFALFPAIVIRKALDNLYFVLTSENGVAGESPTGEAVKSVIFNLFLLLMATAILRGVFVFLMRQALIVMSRYMEYDLKNEMFSKFLRLGTSFFKTSFTGDLISRISEDINKIRMYLGPAVMYAINIISMLGIILYHMFSINAKYSFYVLIPIPILIYTIYSISNLMNRLNERVQKKLGTLTAFVQEAFGGIKVLKAYGLEDIWVKKFEGEVNDYQRFNHSLIRVNSLFFPFILLLIGTSSVITVYVGCKEVLAGKITPGVIAEFLIYINMITWPVASIGWIISLAQRATSAQKRFNETLKEKEPENVFPNEKNNSQKFDIVFSDVSFRYSKTDEDTLKKISCTIKKGEKVAITGKTGSGKSTLVSLLLKLYKPSEGNILIGGHPLSEQNTQTVRKQIGYVSQEVFLFSDTIENNIYFGVNEAEQNEEDLVSVAKKACIYDSIRNFPNGFKTKIGERGVTLSGGQKQRLSIARALIGEHQIYIFDDCFSAVDSKTEKEILQNLSEILKGKTIILICHRISTIQNFERIIVLNDGEIKEEGNHQELIKNKKYYYSLYEEQRKEGKTLEKVEEP